jgi:hypothetical protein
MKYMLMFVADEEAWMALPDEERSDAIARIGAWYGENAASGRILEGKRLQGKGSARTVCLGPAGRSGTPVVTDGPFVETKESIGSYAIIDAANLDAAVAIAKSWPAGGAVEVRPLAE